MCLKPSTGDIYIRSCLITVLVNIGTVHLVYGIYVIVLSDHFIT